MRDILTEWFHLEVMDIKNTDKVEVNESVVEQKIKYEWGF